MMSTSLTTQRTVLRQAAWATSLSLILMAAAAAFVYGFAHSSLVVQGDASATWNHLQSSPRLFQAEILGWLLILLCDIIAAWGLYTYLKPIHPALSLLGAWLRLAYAGVLGAAVLKLIEAMLLSNRSEYLSLFGLKQLQAQVLLDLDTFEFVWSMGLILFGFHLLIVGYIALRAKHIPNVWGILLLVASVGYLYMHVCRLLLLPDEGVLKLMNTTFTIPMIVGELGFGIWLLVKGRHTSESD